MHQSVNLRKFKPDDLQKVLVINRACLPENYTDFFFIELHRRFPKTFLVAEVNGKIVGYALCRIEIGLSHFGLGGLVKKGHMVSIAVLPQGRRKGIAQALVNAAIEGMRFYKVNQCYLEVRVTNTVAINLYKKLGFEITKTIRGYYSDGEFAYEMSRELNSKGNL